MPAGGEDGESAPEKGRVEGANKGVWDRAVEAAASDNEISDWLKTQTPETLDPRTYPAKLRRILDYHE